MERSTAWMATIALAAFSALAGTAQAATETGDMKLEKGYVDPQTGVRVEDVQVDPKTGVETVTLGVPRDGGPVDEVIVTGSKGKKKKVLEQLRPREIVDDREQNYYGVVVYLGKKDDIPVRFYMDARQHQPGDITP